MNTLTIFKTIGLCTIFSVVSGCGQERPNVCDVYRWNHINVSMDQILILPHCFDRKLVSTKGIIKFYDFGVIVYPSQLDYDLGNRYYALHIDLNDIVDQDTLSANIKDGSYVLLYGEFAMSQFLTIHEIPIEIK